MTQFNRSIPAFLASFAEEQAVKQVLPLWAKHAMRQKEGIMGAMSETGQPVAQSDKGAVMNARALWSFAFAFSQTNDPRYLVTATHLFEGFVDHFVDQERGGVFWSLNSQGRVDDDGKPLLAQTYAIYAFAQYYLVTQDEAALDLAHDLHALINRHYLRRDGTYASECARDFSPSTPDIELETDPCHQLHVLEALTTLYLADPDEALKNQLTQIIDLFLTHIFPASDHLPMMLTRDWQLAHSARSYGHNFEAPWLLALACKAIQDQERLGLIDAQLLRLIDKTLEDGQHTSGGILYGNDSSGRPSNTLTWWGQAEASNAFMYAYSVTQEPRYLNAAVAIWQHIKAHWVDLEQGEWFTDLDLNLKPTGNLNKADMWRCVYHTTRACFALSRGQQSLLNQKNFQKKTDAFATTDVSPSLVS